jgi:hypothetical protein
MLGDDSSVQPPMTRSAPEVVAPTNKVIVALPFGNIHIEESSKDFAELARIVAELIATVEGLAPGPKVKKLREQAQTLAARVG